MADISVSVPKKPYRSISNTECKISSDYKTQQRWKKDTNTYPKNPFELVFRVGLPGKYWHACQHFQKDAAYSPEGQNQLHGKRFYSNSARF